METNEKSIRQQKSSINKVNQDIKALYCTLEAQDDSLTQLCTCIEDGLNAQNNLINDITPMSTTTTDKDNRHT